MAQRILKLHGGATTPCDTITKTTFLIDGVNTAGLSIVQFEDGDFGVVRSQNGFDTILHRSDRISELRYFAVCALAQATAFDEIAMKAHLGENPRKPGRPKGTTKTPPKSKYGTGKPRSDYQVKVTVGDAA